MTVGMGTNTLSDTMLVRFVLFPDLFDGELTAQALSWSVLGLETFLETNISSDGLKASATNLDSAGSREDFESTQSKLYAIYIRRVSYNSPLELVFAITSTVAVLTALANRLLDLANKFDEWRVNHTVLMIRLDYLDSLRRSFKRLQSPKKTKGETTQAISALLHVERMEIVLPESMGGTPVEESDPTDDGNGAED